MQVFGFAGYSGAGKTTLIEQLIPRFLAMGKSVSLIKHAHHSFDLDRPGKDSWRHREAGAAEVLVASPRRWVLMHELRDEPEPDLAALVAALSPCDLVLVEGFKGAAIPKLEVHRPDAGNELLWPRDDNIIAIATDEVDRLSRAVTRPLLDLNDAAGIALFITAFLASRHVPATPTA